MWSWDDGFILSVKVYECIYLVDVSILSWIKKYVKPITEMSCSMHPGVGPNLSKVHCGQMDNFSLKFHQTLREIKEIWVRRWGASSDLPLFLHQNIYEKNLKNSAFGHKAFGENKFRLIVVTSSVGVYCASTNGFTTEVINEVYWTNLECYFLLISREFIFKKYLWS